MSMWAPFTEDARQAIVRAQEIAAEHGSASITPDHIFLGAARGAGVAEVLSLLGVTSEALTAAADRVLQRGTAPDSGEMIFSPQAKNVIEAAFTQARELRQQFIAPEHLALACIAPALPQAEVAAALGIDVQHLRQALLESVQSRREPEQTGSAAASQKHFSFARLFEKIAKRSPHRLQADLWPRLEAAVRARDLPGAVFYACAIAVRENVSLEDLFRETEARLRDT